jgi:hypothetical protein
MCRRELGTDECQDTAVDPGRWCGVLAAAKAHGLVGSLQSYAMKRPDVPRRVRDAIRSAWVLQAARNLQLTGALIEIIRKFREYGVEPVVLKGPAVALLASEGVLSRAFTDLDVLVHPEHHGRVLVALETLGYRQVNESLNVRREKDIQCIRDADEVLVELHWALSPPYMRFPGEVAGMWARLQTVYFQNEFIRTLGLEDTLLCLCNHGCVHVWSSIKWVFDIACIVKRKAATLDWRELIERSRTAGCIRALLVGIQLASVLFGVKLPEMISDQVATDTSVKILVERLKMSLLGIRPLSQRDLAACRVQFHERFWGRLFVAVTMPVPELRRLLPETASPITSGPLRFVTRPVRLLHLYGRNWLRAALVGS